MEKYGVLSKPVQLKINPQNSDLQGGYVSYVKLNLSKEEIEVEFKKKYNSWKLWKKY